MTANERLITIREFDVFLARPENANRRFELINGEIVELSPTELHAVLAANITSEIYIYLKQNRIGRVAVEPRHRPKDDEHNDRIPDVAFTSASRALPVTESGSVPQMPDLAIEIKSPDDTYKSLREKAAFYLENGALLVWLVFPEKKQVEVHRPEREPETIEADGTINGEDVLPDFKLKLKTIFDIL